jgi:hypothetical protein
MSRVSEERRNWLEQVKLDAEALTRKRLEDELPKLEREVEARQAKKKEAEEVPAAPAAPVAEAAEVAELKKQLKLERAARTRAENKLNAEPSDEPAEAAGESEAPAVEAPKEEGK